MLRKALPLVFLLWAAPALTKEGFRWSNDLEGALGEARDRQAPIFILIHMIPGRVGWQTTP
jgi:hypothetical protein